jgi:PRC-barrel domain
MSWLFARTRGIGRIAAAARVVGCALVIAIATAANPSTGEAPTVDDGAFGPSETSSIKGASLQEFSHTDLRRVLGKEARSAADQPMGRIVDLLVDEIGQPRAAIIDFGGFLGVGTRKIAIDWGTLRFETAKPNAPVVVALDRDEIKAAPEYKESRDVVAVVSNRRDINP